MRAIVVMVLLSPALWAQKPDEYAGIVLPTSAADLERGKKLYDGSCLFCHGPRGDGGKGANLARPKLSRATTDGDLVRVIQIGLTGTEMPGAWHMTRNEVTQVAAYVRTFARVTPESVPGDPARGRKIYFGKGGCVACHTTRNADGVWEGGLSGPDLSVIGSRRSAAHLRESLTAPAIAVPDGYVDVAVTLKSGEKVSGRLVTAETFVVAVRDASGANRVFPRSDVRELTRRRGESPMPSYKDKLGASELDDLIAFLHSLQEDK